MTGCLDECLDECLDKSLDECFSRCLDRYQTGQCVNMSSCQGVIMSSCHHVNVSMCHHVIMSTCQCVNVSTCHHVNVSSCQCVNMSSCHHVNVSTCHHVNRSRPIASCSYFYINPTVYPKYLHIYSNTLCVVPATANCLINFYCLPNMFTHLLKYPLCCAGVR